MDGLKHISVRLSIFKLGLSFMLIFLMKDRYKRERLSLLKSNRKEVSKNEKNDG